MAPSEIFSNADIDRILAVMVMNDASLEEPCRTLQAMFWCMPGDRLRQFSLTDIKNRLQAILYQRPDYYEVVKVFRGYLGLKEAFEDYGQQPAKLLPVDW